MNACAHGKVHRPNIPPPAVVSSQYVANQHPRPAHNRRVPSNFVQRSSQKKTQNDWKITSRYEFKYFIGSGSYGFVCEAFDHVEKRNVAIKQVKRIFDDLTDCKRMLREIAILNRLNHNNIVKILDIIKPADLLNFDELYVVLEIADSDFKKLFRTSAYINETQMKIILWNLLTGVKYIHSCGVFHRDLKPANCLVNQDCSVKICDFGLARTVELPTLSSQNVQELMGITKDVKLTGHVVTRWYRAPELILLQENYNESIDVWSIGCIFAELLNMMKGSGISSANRTPLFPGSSCFPLSPDQSQSNDFMFYTKENRDQLNVIFNVLGTPSNEDEEFLQSADARRYLKVFSKRRGICFKEKFPAASAVALDLLQRMLVFRPDKRITINEALQHTLFADLVDKISRDVSKGEKVKLPFDDCQSMTEKELRVGFLMEIKRFNPDLEIPQSLLLQ